MSEREPGVTKLIAARIETKSMPWRRDDPYKLGLVVEGATLVDFNKFNSQEEVHDALHLTCRMLYVAGRPYLYRGGFYTDGVVLSGGLALDQAIGDGCSHILALLSRPSGTKEKKVTVADRLIAILLKRDFPDLVPGYWEGFRKYGADLSRIKEAKNGSEVEPRIEAISVPTHSKEVSRLERRPQVLIQGAVDGYNAVMANFAQFDLPVNEDVKIIR